MAKIPEESEEYGNYKKNHFQAVNDIYWEIVTRHLLVDQVASHWTDCNNYTTPARGRNWILML